MAVLLVSLSVMAVLLTVAMPVWRHAAQREREAELVFRGMQYARAVNLFQRKHGPGTLPPSVDALIEEHDLRRQYKDPITGGDFQPLFQGRGAAPGTAAAGFAGRGSASGRGSGTFQPTVSTGGGGQRSTGAGVGSSFGRGAFGRAGAAGRGAAATATGPAVAGFTGVQSKSTDKSIRIYNGRTHYNEWAFIYQPPLGAPGTGAATPGGVPGRGFGPGGGPGRGSPFGPGRGRGFQPTAPGGGRGFRGNVPPSGGRTGR